MPSKKVPNKTQIKRVTKPRSKKLKVQATNVRESHVHRNLDLVSPGMRGQDVKQLQKVVHNGLIKHKINWIECEIDGVLGPQTIKACAFYGWALGLQNKYRKNIKAGHISEYSQKWLRGSLVHSKADKRRQKLRQPKLVKIRKTQNDGAMKAALWAKSKIGVSESPAGSNSGPQISEWEAYWGLGACFWCGVFAGYAVKKIGGAKVNAWIPFGPSIINDAKAHTNGLIAVSPENAQPGDIVVYWNGEHIGLIVAPSRNGQVIAVEGNTSSSDGSQNNGGTVAFKERSISADVTCVARPLY